MNYNTLSPTEKSVKKLQNFSKGHFKTDSEVYNIAVINSMTCANQQTLISRVVSGMEQANARPSKFYIRPFGYMNKVNPATAKYGQSYKSVVASNTEAIIKINRIDGVIVVSDCEIATAGIISGCLKVNCPMLVLPTGINTNFNNDFLKLNGRALAESLDLEETLVNANVSVTGVQENSSTHTFFMALESMGLSLKSATKNHTSGKQHEIAFKTGKKIADFAKDIQSPKRLLTKDAFQTACKQVLQNGIGIGGLMHIIPLLIQNGNKVSHDFFTDIAKKLPNNQLVLVRGSACEDGGYALAGENLNFTGKAWTYHSLEDADRAIAGGAIQEGVIVLLNCAHQDVSSIAYTIQGMNKQNQIAVITDGICDSKDVLCISNCRPTANKNGDLANIQTGDVIEIDLAKGRLNTSISSKDMKARAKRNSVKEQVNYFA